MYYWYGDNPNCGRCGHLNGHGFCSMTACIYPVIYESSTFVVKPQTNADRIRAMTDEELADEMWKLQQGNCPPGDCGHKDFCQAEKCWLEWLKQEAKP